MQNCQIELPSFAASVRSIGVVMRKRGDLAEGDEVRRRMVAFADGEGAVETDTEDKEVALNGNGRV